MGDHFFIEGARDGFQVALRIIPYLVAILVAVGMLRASGALEAVVAVQVRRIRHALAAGLTADAAGIIFAIMACSFFLN